MEVIKLRARAKINLALDVLRRRDDGYHDVKMVMQSINLYDTLTIKKSGQEGIVIKVNLPNIPTDGRNLIYKSAKLMMDKYNIDTGILIYLNKVIPVAAGMAGGSTDAAAAFVGLNQLFELGLSEEELRKEAVAIGADVPYCIMGGTALSEGIGEKLTPLPSPPDCFLVIAKPNLYVSTKHVYEKLHANQLKEHPDIDALTAAIFEKDLQKMAACMGNVLETVTAKEYPIIEEIKERMHKAGALNAMMSGSGPTVFGIFDTKESAERAYQEIGRAKIAKQIFITTFA